MAGVQHLFDFNQALGGRRQWSHSKQDDGLAACRNSLDVSDGGVDVRKSNASTRDEVGQLNYEIYKSQNNSNGMSIKALITKELSKQAESRNQTPNIVARLMGLDALPIDQKEIGKIRASITEPRLSLQPEKQGLKKKPSQLMNQKIARGLASRTFKETVVSKTNQQNGLSWKDHHGSIDPEASALRHPPHKQQINVLKREIVACHVHKVRDRKEFEMKSASQYAFSRKNVNEAKQGDAFEDEYIAGDEKLSESEEFLDAMEFLQSNKELILKFDRKPHTLLAKRLQSYQSHPTSLHQSTVLMKQKKGHIMLGLEQDVIKKNHSKTSSYKREFSDPRIYRSDDSLRRLQPDLISSRSTIQNPHQPLDMYFYPGLFQNNKRHLETMGRDKKIQNIEYEVPVRIVVLKPSPRREKNEQSLHSSSHCFATGLKDFRGGFQGNSEYKAKVCKNCMFANDHSYFRDGLRNPREVAREVVRQIREVVTKDLLLDSQSSARPSVFETRESSLCRCCFDHRETAVSSDGEAATPFRSPLWGSEIEAGSNVALSHKYVRQPLGLDSHVGLPDGLDSHGGNKGSLGRSKIVNIELAKERQLHNCLLEGQHVPLCAQSSSVAYNGGNRDVIRRRQNHGGIGKLMEKNVHCNLEESMDVPLLRNREESLDSLLRKLPKSQSGPVAGSWDNTWVKRRGRGTVKPREAFVGNVVASSVKVNKVKKTKKSIFRKKEASDLYSFTIEHKVHNNKAHSAFSNSSSVFQESLKAECDEICEPECILRETEQMSVISVKSPHVLKENFIVDEMQSRHQICDSVANHEWTFQNYETETTDLDFIDNGKHYVGSATIDGNSDIQHSIRHSSDNLIASKEKVEQPSPVSVLDSPFQDEITSSVGFKGIGSDLHELQLKLPFDDCDGLEHNLEAIPYKQACGTKGYDNCSKTVSIAKTSSDIYTFDELEHVDIKNVELTKEAYAIGREPELLYFIAILVASGFTGDCATILARWHAPDQPINRDLFQKIDQYCCRQITETEGITEISAAGKQCVGKGLLSIPNRRLLFDCLNELLVVMLGGCLVWHPRLMCSKLSNYIMPSGKELMKVISVEACRLLYFHSLPQETLGNLVARDISRGSLWMDFTDDIELTGIELDRDIFNDLIDDTIISIAKQ